MGSQNIKNFQFFGHKNFNFCVLGNLFIFRKKYSTGIHLSPDCVRFFEKDVLEIPELNSNLIIGNLYTTRYICFLTR